MERSLEDSIKNKTYIDNLRSAAKYSKEVIDLVEADIEYGLTMEQTKLYLKRDIKYPQMKLLSQCLRKGADEAFIELLTKYDMSGYQIQVAIEFMEKGISIENIETVIAKGENPLAMRKSFQTMLDKVNEDKKDFNAMLMDSKDMPKVQIITDEKSIEKYGGDKMYFAPPIDYDKVMRLVPCGKLLTVGTIREFFAKQSGADFTEPITAGIFVSIVAWASYQRAEDKTPYWRTLKAKGELNAKYPGGVEAQKEMLEKEGHIVIQKGRTNIKYYVKDYEKALFTL